VEGREASYRGLWKTTRRSIVSGFRDFGSRGVELHDITTPEIAKQEKPKLTLGRVKCLRISCFIGQRGKVLDQGICKIVKSDIPK
jgi:hypothetical protein